MKFLICLLLFTSTALANEKNGLIVVNSKHSFTDTVSKIESLLKKKGFKIFAVIDHSKNAKSAGLQLDPNTVIIFGNPKVGTPIMQESASFGIDLPVKIQISTTSNITSVTYNDPLYFAKRHNINTDFPYIKKMTQALGYIVKTATK